MFDTDNEHVQRLLSNPMMIQRELNDRSLYEFLVWAWPELSGQPFVANWHVAYLCKELEQVAESVGNRRIKDHDLLINVPPGSTKTILCSIVFPVWCWTRWYWLRFITASYSSVLALESAEYSRDLIRSQRFQELYPELTIKADKDTKSNYRIVYRQSSKVSDFHYKEKTGGNRYSTSVGGTLTGFHGDILIWDDPLNPQQAASEKEIEVANRWLDQTLPTRKTDKSVTVTIGIMQRLNQNDPSGHLLEKEKGNLRHICLPGEIRNYRQYLKPEECERYYKDDLFDARRMNWNVLIELAKDLGQYGFAGQIGQNPAPPGGGMFKIDYFQMTSEVIPIYRYAKTVRYWDKAASVGRGAFTVGVKMSLLTDGTFIVDDVKRGQWGSQEREDIIQKTAEADGYNVHVVVEQEPGSGGKESAEGTIRGLAGYVVIADRPTGNKQFRADPYSVQVNAGNIRVRVASWNRAYVEEFELFPNSTYKDQVDASSGAFNYLATKKVARAIGRLRN